MHTTTNNKTCI